MFRLAIAGVFLRAGLNKIASWELTVQLFADEYKVPVLAPEIAARMATTFEIGCSLLLIAGLATRLATLPLLGMIMTIQLFVYPSAYAGASHLGVDPDLPAHAGSGPVVARSAGRARARRDREVMSAEPGRNVGASEQLTAPALRPWQRLGVKLALAFALLTLVTVGLVGALVYERQKREVEDTVGTQLLNIARMGVLLVDPAVHAEAQARHVARLAAYARIKKALVAMQHRDVPHDSRSGP